MIDPDAERSGAPHPHSTIVKSRPAPARRTDPFVLFFIPERVLT